MWEDDDDDFEFEQPDESDKKEFEEREKKIHNLPIMKKAREIYDLTRAITETFDKEKDQLRMREHMLSCAVILGPKIAGAAGSDSYMIQMENAVIIKMNARDLLASTSLVRAESLSQPEYLQVLRDEIENFRLLFLEWIKTFKDSEKWDDGWGMFVE